jgi:hypothetical protein
MIVELYLNAPHPARLVIDQPQVLNHQAPQRPIGKKQSVEYFFVGFHISQHLDYEVFAHNLAHLEFGS